MALTILLSILVNIVLIQGRPEVERVATPSINRTHLDIYANALGRAHYNPWTCNYRSEPGYRCISCSAALHCYPANFALLVQCGGLFPYCRNGYCSRFKTEDCNEDYMFAEGTHGPLRVTTSSNENITMLADEDSPSGRTEQILANSASNTSVITEMTDSNKVEEITSTEAVNIVGVDTTHKPNTDKDPRLLL